MSRERRLRALEQIRQPHLARFFGSSIGQTGKPVDYNRRLTVGWRNE